MHVQLGTILLRRSLSDFQNYPATRHSHTNQENTSSFQDIPQDNHFQFQIYKGSL